MAPGKIAYLHRTESKTRDSALTDALREHEAALMRFLRVRLANELDREDIAQEVFVRLCQQVDLTEKLSYGTKSTRSYLFTIATNLIRDMMRREASRSIDKHDEFDESRHVLSKSATEDRVQQNQELVLVRKAIRKLERKCREAFVLSRFCDMSYRDISERMGVSCSMVEKYISQALVQLRRSVGRIR